MSLVVAIQLVFQYKFLATLIIFADKLTLFMAMLDMFPEIGVRCCLVVTPKVRADRLPDLEMNSFDMPIKVAFVRCLVGTSTLFTLVQHD